MAVAKKKTTTKKSASKKKQDTQDDGTPSPSRKNGWAFLVSTATISAVSRAERQSCNRVESPIVGA